MSSADSQTTTTPGSDVTLSKNVWSPVEVTKMLVAVIHALVTSGLVFVLMNRPVPKDLSEDVSQSTATVQQASEVNKELTTKVDKLTDNVGELTGSINTLIKKL